jgi:murein DD-endopeptidase MepM/ murein hydrolase activator NlpD
VTHATVIAMTTLLALVLVLPLGQWPIESPTVVQGFHPPAANWNAGHRGVDLAAATGDPIRSMAAGTVSFVGVIGGIPVVTIRYPGPKRERSTYQPVSAIVHVGDQVAEGQVLGSLAADGGHCGGVRHCLHVGLRTDSAYLDPAGLVEDRPIILKPGS